MGECGSFTVLAEDTIVERLNCAIGGSSRGQVSVAFMAINIKGEIA